MIRRDDERFSSHSENQCNKAVNGGIYKSTICESYRAFYSIEPKKQKSKNFKTIEECEQWLIEMRIRYPR